MITHYVCRTTGCRNYGARILYATVYLRRDSRCRDCGVEMKAVRSADRKVSRKIVGKSIISRTATYKKRTQKRVAKRNYKRSP